MNRQPTDKINFTKKTLDALPLPEGGRPKDYYDKVQRSLLVRVTSTGNKTFYVRRKIKNRSERILLGRYPEVSIEQARKLAVGVLADLASGSNPQDRLKTESSDDPTLAEAIENYLDGHARPHCVRVADMVRDFRRYFTDLRNRKCSSIKRPDAQTKIATIYKNHGRCAANHALVLVKAAMNWNITHGYVTGDNPWMCVKSFKIQSRERFLLPEEMGRFFAALKTLENEIARDYIKLSLLTGARRNNVLSMRWEDVNFELALWRIPMTKNGESHTVPLTDAAIAVLKERLAKRESEWVFPGKVPGAHLVEPKRVWHKLLEEAQISNLRLHDLRRTLGSYLAITNQSLPIIGRALGHKSTQATEIYARLTQEPVRKALEQAHEAIFEAANLPDRTPPGANVVQFRRRKNSTLDSAP